ncbi:MAG: alpha/beta hydrolase [bacterium]|nr:alpha/beta hydrolase [bacterium]
MDTPESRFIERDGLRLHALDHGGEGKPVLLMLHGAAAHAHWWDHVAPSLKPLCRPVAVDMRGHGDSDWAKEYTFEAFAGDLSSWIEWARKESGRPPAILAHSMGGLVTLKLHEWSRPELTCLIVVDSPLELTNRILAEVELAAKNPSRPWASPDLFVQKFRLLPSSGKAAPEQLAYIARHSLRPLDDGTWLLKTDKSFHRDRKPTDLRPGWKKVAAPTLLIAGELSDRLAVEDFAWIEDHCPAVRTAIVPEAHHHVYMDAPEAFLHLVQNFLSENFS